MNNQTKTAYQLLKPKKSDWLEKIKEKHQLNTSKKKRSQKIALRVLRVLRQKGLNQIDLAERMDVSAQLVNRWLKGRENFTLETIEKFEDALDIELIQVVESKVFASKATNCIVFMANEISIDRKVNNSVKHHTEIKSTSIDYGEGSFSSFDYKKMAQA
jgi:transcriptional regulator with XRE-family HTH domain